jgi:hypothetical protein
MRAQDIIRAVLDLLDHDDEPKDVAVKVDMEDPVDISEPNSRFKQIFAMLQNRDSNSPLSNAPNEVVTDIDSVTTLAGGGPNAPKHPHDIRVAQPSMYPNQQEKF